MNFDFTSTSEDLHVESFTFGAGVAMDTLFILTTGNGDYVNYASEPELDELCRAWVEHRGRGILDEK